MIKFDHSKYRVGQYSISIPEGKMYQEENGAWYCALQDGQKFTFHLQGPSWTKALFKLKIQNVGMTGERGLIATFDHIPCILERPVHTDQSFVFYKTFSKMGKELGIENMDAEKRGLVYVQVYPEIQRSVMQSRSLMRGTSGQSTSSGAAALSGEETGQKFGESSIGELGQPIEFVLRLVHEDPLNSKPTLIQDTPYPKPVKD